MLARLNWCSVACRYGPFGPKTSENVEVLTAGISIRSGEFQRSYIVRSRPNVDLIDFRREGKTSKIKRALRLNLVG